MASDTRSSFARLLQHYRRAAGLSQEELAARTGYSVSYLSKLERGQRRPPQSAIEMLAKALHLATHDQEALRDARTGGNRQDVLIPLANRDVELAALERHLAGMGPQVLFLTGEPGIGKTRLLQEVMERAHRGRLSVLAASCPRDPGPFSPLLEAIADFVHEQPAQQLGSYLQGCEWLACLLPELANLGISPPPGLSPEQERRLMFRAVARFLRNVAGPDGTLVILDDLQWAGRDALDLLAALLRSSTAIRVLGAYRSTEVQPEHPLAGLQADLVRTGQAKELLLGPLVEEAAEELLSGLLTGREVEEQQVTAAVHRAEGVPLYLVSFARAIQEGSLQGTPADLAQIIRQRVVALSGTTRPVLRVAAIAGRHVPYRVLCAVAQQPEETTLLALDALVLAGLLTEVGEDAYRVSHELIREVVEGDLGMARRAILHGRVGAALEELVPASEGRADDHLAELAYHYGRSGEREKALRYLEQAGDLARRRHAHSVAERYYRELLERLVRLQREHDSGRVGVKLGEVLITAGHYDDALAVLERAAQQCRAAGDLEGEAQATVQIAEAHFYGSTPSEGLQYLQRVRESWRGPWHNQAWLSVVLAKLLFISLRYSESAEVAIQAADLGRAHGDNRIVAVAETAHAMALHALARFKDALAVVKEALPLAGSFGDLALQVAGLNTASTSYEATGEWEENRIVLAQALVAAEQLCSPSGIAYTLQRFGRDAFLRGEWETAEDYLQRSLAISRDLGSSLIAPYPPLEYGRLSLGKGNWESARHYLEEAIEHATKNGDLQGLCAAHQVLAELDIRAGHPDAVAPRLEPLLDRLGQQSGASPLLATLAWSQIEMGREEEAADCLMASFRSDLLRYGCIDLAMSLRLRAMMLARQAHWPEAQQAFQDALDHVRRLPYPYAEAQTLFEYGMFYSAQAEPKKAHRWLDKALVLFQRLHAKKDIERTEQALARLAS